MSTYPSPPANDAAKYAYGLAYTFSKVNNPIQGTFNKVDVRFNQNIKPSSGESIYSHIFVIPVAKSGEFYTYSIALYYDGDPFSSGNLKTPWTFLKESYFNHACAIDHSRLYYNASSGPFNDFAVTTPLNPYEQSATISFNQNMWATTNSWISTPVWIAKDMYNHELILKEVDKILPFVP